MKAFRCVVAAACAATVFGGMMASASAQPADEARVRTLEDEVNNLKQTIEQLRAEEREHEEKLIGPVLRGQATAPTPVVVAPPAPEKPLGLINLGGLPIKISGNIVLRYDYSNTSDPTDILIEHYTANTFRYRLRLGADFGDPNAAVTGGIRISAAQTPNPTVAFASIGGGFTPKQIGFDQWWILVRPLADRDRLGLIFGKAPNPIWRGSVGSWRTELIWDDDVSPEGVALHVDIFKTAGPKPSFKLDDVAAYYQIEDILDLRFQGRTGVTNLFVDQLRFFTKWLDGALAYYNFENLNNGLSAPGAALGRGVSAQAATSAFLLRPNTFFVTNDTVNYGPNALGFRSGSFRLLNATLQFHAPIHAPSAGDPDVFVLVDYVHNFSVPDDRDGIRGTVGIRLGSYKVAFHPLNFYFTYGYVQRDATLASFADSDLGSGTGYYGLEAGASYRFTKNLEGAIIYANYYAQPVFDNHAQRLFVDIRGDF